MSAGLDRGAAAFGVLRLGAVEVAIPAANLQEAVVWPSGITPRPRSAPYILGTFNLRGMAIPTIDLRVLLANADAQAKPLPLSGQEKVVIVRHPAGRMGLVVDAVSEVMRLPADRMHGLVCGSPTATRESSLIKSLFMADGGSRLVHVLDLDILASFPDVMLAHVAEATTSITTQRGPRHHYLTFRCAELDLCLDATAVRQIIEAPVIERTFLTNELCRGFVHQRGQAVPVLSLPMLLEVGHHAHDERLLLVMELDGLPLGLLIDGVTAIVRRRPAEVMPLPSFGVARPALYVGMLPDCGDGGPGDALLLNHEALARHEQVGPLLRLHAARHDTATSEASATASLAPGRTRQTFLTYSAGSSLSSPLAHIREIITYPNSLVRLGTQDGPMAGMLNRGGMMTPLVDLRRLLGQDKRDWSVRPKVLIVQDGNTNFGFIVDTVDAIVFVKPDEEMICTDRVVILPNGHPALAQLLRLAMIEGSVQRRTMTLLDLAGLARTLQQEAVSAGQTSALPMLSKNSAGVRECRRTPRHQTGWCADAANQVGKRRRRE